MPRHGHHRARAVAADDIIGDPDWHARTRDGVPCEGACGYARLLRRTGDAISVALARRRLDIGAHCVPMRRDRDFRDKRVLWRQHDICHAHERVWARGEHLDVGVRVVRHGEVDGGSLGAADPAALRGQRTVRPVDQLQVFVQPVGVGGDAQQPLPERRAHDREVADLAGAVDHLLVRQHGAESRTPVDRDVVLVRQATLEQLEKHPLRPADVAGVRRVDLPRPVVAEA